MSRASGSIIKKRSVRILGHATSLSLEAEFWSALREIARRRGLSLNRLIENVDAARNGNLSSALRVFVLECYRRGELTADVPVITVS
ncbi:MAG TPA: ribbon-helix-helix domain-containing protein [Stellaceae bacterium]|nr:ribbon-helix-helix domain-containing protein [Stellaceae bacterium]